MSFSELASALASDNAWPSINALITITKNLVQKPQDERVRTLRCANEAVQRKLLEWPVASQFLFQLGFAEIQVSGATILSISDDCDPSRFQVALSALKSVSSETQATTPSSGPRLKQRLRRPPPNAQRVSYPAVSFQGVIRLQAVKKKLQNQPPPFGETFLFYGPRGSGKTTVAHAAAEAWGLKVLTVWGTEVHTPFARGHTAALSHFAAHAHELGSCVILLRGMDPILASVVQELKQLRDLPRAIVIATCVATEGFVTDGARKPLQLLRRRSSGGSARVGAASSEERSATPPPSTASQPSSLLAGSLDCFDHLVFVPFDAQDVPSIALLLLRAADCLGATLAAPAADEAARLVLSAVASTGALLSGHVISDVARSAVQKSRLRDPAAADGNLSSREASLIVFVSVDMVRCALDDWREKILLNRNENSAAALSTTAPEDSVISSAMGGLNLNTPSNANVPRLRTPPSKGPRQKPSRGSDSERSGGAAAVSLLR